MAKLIPNDSDLQRRIRGVILAERAGLDALYNGLSFDKLGHDIEHTTRLIASLGDGARLIVTGIGKSGNVGEKIAATFASLGTPAQFIHATEACHGNLGMICQRDCIIGMSWSGESPEVGAVLEYAFKLGCSTIAMTAGPSGCPVRSHAAVTLELPKVSEACLFGLAPTTSTIMMLALGDAMAVATAGLKGYTREQLAKIHPAGAIGKALTQ